MFSDYYTSFDKEIRAILNSVKEPSEAQLRGILEKSRSQQLTLEEIAGLLEVGRSGGEKPVIIRDFLYKQFRMKEGNRLRYIAPVYLSSFCIDKCGYCQFSANRKDTERIRLLPSQLEEELGDVLNTGSRVIEFTLATDPIFTSEKLAEYILLARKILNNEAGSGVLLCSDHFSTEVYQRLREAGLYGMVQWDETLDKEQFEKWHGNSPRKGDFYTRINNHDRAVQAGLQIASGCLFGLSDFRYDVLMQLAKARYIEAEYGRKPFVFGTPRLKSIGGIQLHPSTEVNDLEYELALMTYKIAEPQIARWLQTRETPKLNLRNIADRDVYTYRCGEVKPGGYKVNKNRVNSCRGGQFEVSEMTRLEFEQELKKRGFRVDYAWVNN